MKAVACLLLSCVGLALGQTGSTPFVCVANGGVPPVLRSEGLTELTGDIVIQCTGGVPTPVGQNVPQVHVTVFLNTQVTSRLLGSSNQSEALLLIDEPQGASNPNTPYLPCPSTSGCGIPGTGGQGVYDGAPGHYNVFQGIQTGANQVQFLGVPVLAPGKSGARVFRITNLRANAAALGQGTALTLPQITGQVSFTPWNGPAISILDPQQTLGFVQPGLLAGVTPGSFQQCQGFNNNQLFSEKTPGVPGAATFSVQFSEGFSGAFKPQQSSIPATPGQPYSSESGLSIPGLPSSVGLADYGTRLRTVFNNIPPGVNLFIPAQNGLSKLTSGASTGTATTTANNAATSGTGLVLTPDSSGSASATFEIKSIDPSQLSALNIPVTLQGFAATTPANITTTLSFWNTPLPQTTLFAPGSPSTVAYPAFTPLDPGISNPELVFSQFVASIVPCVNSGVDLSSIGNPAFQSATQPASLSQEREVTGQAVPSTTLTVPRVSNVGLVSTQLPAGPVTVTQDPSATWLNVTLNQTTSPVTAYLSVNTAAAGVHSTTLQFNAPGAGPVSVPVTYSVAPGPWFTRFGFDHQASYVSDVVAPGEPFTVFGGDAFGPGTLAPPALDSNGRAVTTLGNTQVLFDGQAAPLYYSVDNSGVGQVAGFAPFALASATQTNVQVVYNGVASPPVSIPVVNAAPGLYTADSSGGGQGSFLNQDGSVNSSSNPEAVGNLVVLYGGGAGQTSPGGRDGALAGNGAPVATFTLPVKVFIDGIQATDIPYAGPAPGIVEGVFQIDVRIPSGVRSTANVPVVVQIDDKQSQPGVTLATK